MITTTPAAIPASRKLVLLAPLSEGDVLRP